MRNETDATLKRWNTKFEADNDSCAPHSVFRIEMIHHSREVDGDDIESRGDITELDVDAIVNAANTTLLGGGGVDGAIHRAAGPELLAECRKLGGCRPGQAKITRGYRLPARFVIHTVGPVWRGGKHGEPETLADCYRNSLQLAVENEIETLAFPAISCGAYGYPIKEAAQIAFKATREFLAGNDNPQKVIFVVWGEDVYDAYREALQK